MVMLFTQDKHVVQAWEINCKLVLKFAFQKRQIYGISYFRLKLAVACLAQRVGLGSVELKYI